MSATQLVPERLTPELFEPFGEVIQKKSNSDVLMNSGRFERYLNLATIDTSASDGFTNIGIVSSRVATELPYRIQMVERHPLGSQAFVPLRRFSFVVVVAPAGDNVDPGELRAFRTDGEQGINYYRGVWHMPLISLEAGQDFLVIDRAGRGTNCDELQLQTSVTLTDR